ncbi:MAG: hypothetical protein H0T73_16160 [Ardenticatenales bacterium]|nr:hypothetical protein [Ardenticatenales bacterium]
MDTHDPRFLPGEFGNVDNRDTHPVPGKQKQPYPPPALPSQAFFEGKSAGPTAIQTGVGGSPPGDVGSKADGYELNPPERHAPDEAVVNPDGHVVSNEGHDSENHS